MLYAVLPPASDPLPPLPSAHARDPSPASSAGNAHGAAAVGGAAHGRRGTHARAKSWDVGACAEGGEKGERGDAGRGSAAPRLVPAMMSVCCAAEHPSLHSPTPHYEPTTSLAPALPLLPNIPFTPSPSPSVFLPPFSCDHPSPNALALLEASYACPSSSSLPLLLPAPCPSLPLLAPCHTTLIPPLNPQSHVTAVEVTLADGRFLATAVLPADEAEAACRASQERAAAAHSAAQSVPPRPARPSFLRLSSASFSRSGSRRHKWKSQEGVGEADGRAEARRDGAWGESSGKEGVVSGGVERGEGGGESGEGGESRRRRGGNGDEDEEEEEVEGSGGQRQRCVARRHAAVLLDESPTTHTPHMLRLRIPKITSSTTPANLSLPPPLPFPVPPYSSYNTAAVCVSVRVRVTYIEAMAGRQGYSEMSLPLTVPLECVPDDLAVQDVVRVSCTINSGLQCPMKIGDFNHPMKVVCVDLGRATFVGHQSDDDPEAWPNADFTISFQVGGNAGTTISASGLHFFLVPQK
ncbi:unnamed protein product [Closterium sp. Naga37s-1]|nr:unnamed protein product [Closterium sp. Naga37s-1]